MSHDLENGLWLREAVNVPDAVKRDALVRRVRRIRAEVVAQRESIQRWNALHPTTPLTHHTEDAIIAWLEGHGPMPRANLDESL